MQLPAALSRCGDASAIVRTADSKGEEAFLQRAFMPVRESIEADTHEEEQPAPAFATLRSFLCVSIAEARARECAPSSLKMGMAIKADTLRCVRQQRQLPKSAAHVCVR
jgi:hypothetical protein